ncbi:hypothetical protein RFF05_15790 [Bengtsoniella intestinalis]|uniref:hypothetical protein n=1 Tax=Bengtsoniella intestinalis TaxID=3073143 RepID=UPI00391F65AE
MWRLRCPVAISTVVFAPWVARWWLVKIDKVADGKTTPLGYGIFDHINTLIFGNLTATGGDLRH